ncbi:excinuclease ABC subunit UvrC [Marinibactrum halimedae]|uniref:UvrABC system protein C n=1 Tax=Marinibactrum halimedae TaxID=1444977 RepID=A0AA37T7D7_9GAMM|nr:excinuclease ABC subunit UvrC [Marinibactrum halimedae]MCD9460045.1 excinuclease ABC subunit UvrC [Marinibactrum halimedae]GLS26443.1 UvrABC system protein C [Marinibactrum halimedae]
MLTDTQNEHAELDAVFDHRQFLASVSRVPGVYQMYDRSGAILYVGKAKQLRNRLSSYFRETGLSPKTQALVKRIANIQVTPTQSELEALLLEQNLIKSQKPPYNILLRDDKSYPYIFVSSNEAFPRIALHRGPQKKRGHYFGPYPNVAAVRESLNFLQKTFRIRQCEDSVYRNRSRPCLQYQIGRCKAPCVEAVEREEYDEDLRHTQMFLQGKNQELTQELAHQMDVFSQDLAFEKAAECRDQISALSRLQAEQVAETGVATADVMGVAEAGGELCVHVLFVREGRILGSKSYFPKNALGESVEEVVQSFLAQFYLANQGRDVPSEIVLQQVLPSVEVLEAALLESKQKKVVIRTNVRSQRAKWLELATRSAEQNLATHNTQRSTIKRKYEQLQEVLALSELPKRMECFDISHSSGEKTVASCVVFDEQGPRKSDYRRFNIDDITPGDDYAAMHQALTRRYTRIVQGEGILPDILVIDGGKGQVNEAAEVLSELGVHGVFLLGVAKGTTRKAGFETLYLHETSKTMTLDSTAPALHLLQSIRDEAHRFAITGHKNRRDKARKTSTLESIPGVGNARRKELLRHFGGLQGVKAASVDDLKRVKGISRTLAEDIYHHLNGE